MGERERDIFGILYTGYLLSKIKREIKERERERKREQQIINKIEIDDTHLFMK